MLGKCIGTCCSPLLSTLATSIVGIGSGLLRYLLGALHDSKLCCFDYRAVLASTQRTCIHSMCVHPLDVCASTRRNPPTGILLCSAAKHPASWLQWPAPPLLMELRLWRFEERMAVCTCSVYLSAIVDLNLADYFRLRRSSR